jgi:hypothetical protein
MCRCFCAPPSNHPTPPPPPPHPTHPPQSCAPELSEDDIRMVLSADGTPLGEAFVLLRGPRAKLRLALSKDRSIMAVRRGPRGGAPGGPGRLAARPAANAC